MVSEAIRMRNFVQAERSLKQIPLCSAHFFTKAPAMGGRSCGALKHTQEMPFGHLNGSRYSFYRLRGTQCREHQGLSRFNNVKLAR